MTTTVQKNRNYIWSMLLLPVALAAQQKPAPAPLPPAPAVIYLSNPSFEDTPHAGQKGGSAPKGWYDCGKPGETPPDVQPGFFNVLKPAVDGATFMGLVVRDNETWEGVGQRLSQPLLLGKTYEFSINLCRADEYMSKTTLSNDVEVSFSTPVKIRVWGGNGFCDHAELLYETPLVVNTRWLSYPMVFKPKKSNVNFIMIEAYFKTPVLFPYNGNVLIDNASPIKEVADKKKPDIAQTVPPVKKPQGPPAGVPGKSVTKATPPASPAPIVRGVEKDITKIDPRTIKKGDVLPLPNLYFDADRYDIKAESMTAMNNLLMFLQNNPSMKVEIAGHTNNLLTDVNANRLSDSRAKSVADWLIARGIPADRVQYKGYGKTQPLVPNTNDEGRKKNQRVEIKILSVTG